MYIDVNQEPDVHLEKNKYIENNRTQKMGNHIYYQQSVDSVIEWMHEHTIWEMHQEIWRNINNVEFIEIQIQLWKKINIQIRHILINHLNH